MNLAAIGGATFAADQFSLGQFIGQTDGGVMFHLKTFTEFADQQAVFV